MQNITPELALIDAELAAAARRLLPDPGDCLARRPRGTALEPSPDWLGLEYFPESATNVPPPSVRREWPALVGAGVAWALLAAILGSSMLAFIPPSESARPRLVESSPGAVSTSSPRVEPSSAERSQAVATLRWPSFPTSSGYSIILTRGENRYSFWAAGTALKLAERPRDLTVVRLPPGTYAWSVYPVLRIQKHVSFDAILASGVVRVPDDEP